MQPAGRTGPRGDETERAREGEREPLLQCSRQDRPRIPVQSWGAGGWKAAAFTAHRGSCPPVVPKASRTPLMGRPWDLPRALSRAWQGERAKEAGDRDRAGQRQREEGPDSTECRPLRLLRGPWSPGRFEAAQSVAAASARAGPLATLPHGRRISGGGLSSCSSSRRLDTVHSEMAPASLHRLWAQGPAVCSAFLRGVLRGCPHCASCPKP